MRARTLLAVIPLMCALAAEGDSGDRESGDLHISLSGMNSDAGAIVYALWSGPEHWLGDGAIREGRAAIEDGQSLIRLDGLPYGEYAFSAYHDLNDNGRLDTGFLKIPKEPLGISNDARSRFGPPKYRDARFVLDRPRMTIAVTVKKIF
jgi:uncharacterized protein (DUF2141 family)